MYSQSHSHTFTTTFIVESNKCAIRCLSFHYAFPHPANPFCAQSKCLQDTIRVSTPLNPTDRPTDTHTHLTQKVYSHEFPVLTFLRPTNKQASSGGGRPGLCVRLQRIYYRFDSVMGDDV